MLVALQRIDAGAHGVFEVGQSLTGLPEHCHAQLIEAGAAQVVEDDAGDSEDQVVEDDAGENKGRSGSRRGRRG